MMEMARITIKGTSGYCSVDHAYSDKVTMTPDSISYEYKPYEESNANRPIKWSYRTSSPSYRELFEKVAEEVSAILARNEEDFVTDIGSTTFVVTFADKTRAQRTFYLPHSDFADCFALVKKMVPSLESVPAAIRTSGDY